MSDDNGLYYMRARYYNIDIKRFINQDVVIGSIASSKSLNRYAYVEGNPVSYLDPFGLEKRKLDNLFNKFAKYLSMGGTVSVGFSFSIAAGGAFSTSAGLTVDSTGNVAIQVTPGFGGGMPSVSA